jgi:acyl-[acyl carrier protein]--UDP-N-acetylglucosamine O-acyltransferase
MRGTSESLFIHHTAVVAAGASIGRDVRIGAFAIVEDDVHIGDQCIIGPHAVIRSGVRMGQRNRIEPHAVIGGDPQHLSFDRDIRSGCSIGDDNVFRESVTVNRASLPGAFTRIGEPVRHFRLNVIGLRRAGIDREERTAVECMFRSLRARAALPAAGEMPAQSAPGRLCAWLSAPSQRGLSGFIATAGKRDHHDGD